MKKGQLFYAVDCRASPIARTQPLAWLDCNGLMDRMKDVDVVVDHIYANMQHTLTNKYVLIDSTEPMVLLGIKDLPEDRFHFDILVYALSPNHGYVSRLIYTHELYTL